MCILCRSKLYCERAHFLGKPLFSPCVALDEVQMLGSLSRSTSYTALLEYETDYNLREHPIHRSL